VRAFGLIHEHAATPKSLTGQAANMGISTCVAEIGGGGLSSAAEERCVALGVQGYLQCDEIPWHVPSEIEILRRQLVFEIARMFALRQQGI
jgi:hypothetical protein